MLIFTWDRKGKKRMRNTSLNMFSQVNSPPLSHFFHKYSLNFQLYTRIIKPNNPKRFRWKSYSSRHFARSYSNWFGFFATRCTYISFILGKRIFHKSVEKFIKTRANSFQIICSLWFLTQPIKQFEKYFIGKSSFFNSSFFATATLNVGCK